MTATTIRAHHAVHLDGSLDPHLSRWLWLVKMLLAIPHFVILGLLSIPFIITTLFAGIVVLTTGRYPRRLFDFNVEILRWNWRVGFYVYAALGTDQYPPFTLAPRADYPAQFDIAYTARQSRKLVLVKWLITVPHLVIVGLIMGDLLSFVQRADVASAAFSVLNVLVVTAGVFLLITSKYPRPLFDLLIGLNRWVYRVLAYVAFMHDEYPPFRLDTRDSHALEH